MRSRSQCAHLLCTDMSYREVSGLEESKRFMNNYSLGGVRKGR